MPTYRVSFDLTLATDGHPRKWVPDAIGSNLVSTSDGEHCGNWQFVDLDDEPATQKVYGLISTDGDGSCSMHWFTDWNKVEELLCSHEDFMCNDAGPATVLTLPANCNLADFGIRLSDA